MERAARVLGISKSTAFRAVKTGEIPSFHMGRRILVPTAKLIRLVEGDLHTIPSVDDGANVDIR